MTQEELNKLIGQNIRKYRLIYSATEHKLTQADLAKQIGVTTAFIGLLESNSNSQGLSVYNLLQISEALNIPINKFFEKVWYLKNIVLFVYICWVFVIDSDYFLWYTFVRRLYLWESWLKEIREE